MKILISFWGTPPNSIGFHCKIVFFHSSTTPVVGGTLRWAWKTHFLMQYKNKLIISGDLLFFLKRSSLGTSDIQGCYSPKGITYMIFALIHGRDPIPWRITYIEFRSPVKIFINFLRNTTQFHLFSLQNMFFFIVHPAIAPAKRVATHFPCWNRSCPFAELVWITGGCSNPCFCQKPEKIYFPGSKWIAGNILCICCFFRFRQMFLFYV